MPYPRNLEMAKEVEAIVRKHGAVPATVAIIDGVPKAGLTESDLLKLANSGSGVVLKASTRDIAYACATGATAATTVASTMKLAHLAGISGSPPAESVGYTAEQSPPWTSPLIYLSCQERL
jgi:pseudouridine-5'-phosphate glycosidase